MAMIWGNWFSRIKGGWKTVGASGVGAFDSGQDWIPTQVGPISAMKLSAYFACVRLLSETMGSMTFQLYDNRNNVIDDHDLYGLMRYSPNQFQTGDSFVSAMAGNKTVFGNSMAHIKRQSNGKPYMLDFYTTELWDVESDDQGRPKFKLNGEAVPNEDVLHWAGFGLSGYWGLPTLVAGGEAMSMMNNSPYKPENVDNFVQSYHWYPGSIYPLGLFQVPPQQLPPPPQMPPEKPQCPSQWICGRPLRPSPWRRTPRTAPCR